MIIIINGSINSGKSTISKILAKKIGNCAVIEVDKLREFVDFMQLSRQIVDMNLLNAAKVAETFIENGLDVIIEYPLSQCNYDFLTDKLDKFCHEITVITLNPRLEVAIKSRGERKLTDWEVNRIKEHYKMGINNPTFDSVLIDNSMQTPDETADEILSKILK